MNMGDDEQVVVSMVDVLEQDNELEEEAAAVLGDSDDKGCTYPLGYVSRQALYACITCRNTQDSLAGICLACSYECHEGHEFVELYTKRNFRCDCGNSKFPNLNCKLFKIKQPVNPENIYNHNFSGVYCTCKRPYPDPDDSIEDEMIQCVVCEDWFHGRHLGLTSVPDSEGYQEMICETCMLKCDFLWNYTLHSVVETKVMKEETSANVDVTSMDDTKPRLKEAEDNTSTKGSQQQSPGSAGPASHNGTMTNEVQSGSNHISDSKTLCDANGPAFSSIGSTQVPDRKTNETVAGESSSTSVVATVTEPCAVSSSTNSVKCFDELSGAEDAQRTETSLKCEITSSGAAAQVENSAEAFTSSFATKNTTLLVTRAKDEVTASQAASSSSPAVATTVPTSEASPSQVDSVEDKNLIACKCRLKELSCRTVERKSGAVFWPEGWRSKLCSCSQCKVMYDDLKVSFLPDSSDSVAAYEERGKGKRKRSQYDQGMEALSNMDRVQQGEMMHGYHSMKSALSEFLQSFAEQGKVVTANDIQEFYESLNRKRQRVGSASSMQYLCR